MAPFPVQTVTWRIQELAPDGRTARVSALLSAEALIARLDEVLGRYGWSLSYRRFGNGVGCELLIDGVTKSAIVEPVRGTEDAEECGRSALARAAELFGMLPPAEMRESRWVDYDPDEDVALVPELAVEESHPSVGPVSADTDSEPIEPVKPEGQQAIDRLVERLKADGSGLAAARLLVKYGGYGSDPEAARELYGKLRELLARPAEASA